MKKSYYRLRISLLCAGIIGLMAIFSAHPTSAQQKASPPGDPTGYIGGTVTSPNGPEAGVWVIAGTTDLPTKFAKIVVTDDRGRYMLPELPSANYRVWVRGYGLVDSTPIEMKPSANNVALKAVLAKTPQEAAKV